MQYRNVSSADLITGVAGSAIHFKPLQEKFRSALWAIQVTPDTPVSSFQEQAAFYYQKIKVCNILIATDTYS
jgi:hypothetical protein